MIGFIVCEFINVIRKVLKYRYILHWDIILYMCVHFLVALSLAIKASSQAEQALFTYPKRERGRNIQIEKENSVKESA